MISQINVVLVRPTYSGNIGAAVRALANMGGERIILIDPKCSIDENTRAAASGAQAWLKRITIYDTWEQFYSHEPEGFRISLSRRSGKKRPSLALAETLTQMFEQVPDSTPTQPLFLFFGPEASGLSAEDMAWTHRTAQLPIAGTFKSLNLAQAVLLGLFVTQQTLQQLKPRKTSAKKMTENVRFPDESIRRWLEAMGFSLEKRRKSAYLTIRRLLLQNWPSPQELLVLEAILQQNIRKLEEWRRLKNEKERLTSS